MLKRPFDGCVRALRVAALLALAALANAAQAAGSDEAAASAVDWWSELPPYRVGAVDAPAVAEAPVPSPPPAAERPAAVVAADPGDVWDRIRGGFAMPDLATKPVAAALRWYRERPDYIDRMASRASRYLFHIVEEVERRGMPTELALLPFVESAMQPEAESHARAAGLWQFIPSTGKRYALEQNVWKDERRDVVESTRAALDYLQKLYDEFGDWHLALAAYNMGEAGLARAIQRNRRAKKPTDYASLRLPRETQSYVPKLQAIKNIVRDPEANGIALPAIRNEPYFVTVTKTRDIDVATAAELAEMPLDEFLALNPSFNRPVILGAAQPTLLLPADRVEVFRSNLAAYEATGQPLASWTAYTLKPNETLAKVAERAGISEAKLREANRVPPRYKLAPGSTILIPRDESMDEDIAPELLHASFTLVPDGRNLRQITYRVRRGDTLHKVARRWNVRPDEIVAWNRLRSEELFAGQRLRLTVAVRPAPKKTAAPAGKSAAKAKVHATAGKPATRSIASIAGTRR
jgi:membrane-bound lytic murein transglycosylase D